MAELTIDLRRNPATGKQDVTISLKSDEDALPHEHEQQHRALVDKLIEGGIVKASELGQLVIEREQSQTQGVPQSQPEPQRQPQAQGH